jgi:predicted dehydrogenase
MPYGKKLKLAILGCGMVADYHIKGVFATGDAEIVALCDSSSNVLARMLNKYNIGRGETDYTRILADENINAVIICTPPHSHYQLAMEVINAHKHVLIEKPFVITKSEMYSLQHKAADNPHLVVMESSARHSRLQPKFNYIKNLISSGDLGDIYAIHHNAVFRKSRPGIEYHADATWFYDKKLAGGGPLIDWGVYDLSFHLGILNDNVNLKYLKSFHVNGLDQKSANNKFSVEEHGIVMMEFDNKLIYYWERASNAHNEALNETRIYGSKGGLKFNYLTWGSSKIIYYRLTRKGMSKKNLIPLEMGKHKSHLEDFYALDAHFVQCILGKQKPILPLSLSVKHLEIIFQALKTI